MIPETEPADATPLDDGETRLRAIIREEVTAALELVQASSSARCSAPDTSLLSARDVAALLRVDERTLRRLVREGAVPEPLRIGRRAIRWDARALRVALGLEQPAARATPPRRR